MANRSGKSGTVTDFIFLGSKITADGDCSLQIKRHLLIGRKAMIDLDSVLESRGITLPTKVHIVKTMVFPVVVWMWELDCKEGWAPKNWCFWTVVLEKTLESPLDCKEIQPVHSKVDQPWVFLEGMMLKLQYFGHLMWRVDSLEKTLMLGGIGGSRRRRRQRMRWLDGITDLMDWVWVNSGSWWWTGRPGVLWFMGSQRVGHDWATDLIWSDLT